MMDDDIAGPKADGFNYDKIEVAPPRSEGVLFNGVGPLFKRKRSYWRAVRRGEVWALIPICMQHLARKISAEMFGGKIPEQNFLVDRHIPNDVFYLIRKNK